MFTKQTGLLYLMKSWTAKKNNREEALSYDEHSVGVFKKEETLVGQNTYWTFPIDWLL